MLNDFLDHLAGLLRRLDPLHEGEWTVPAVGLLTGGLVLLLGRLATRPRGRHPFCNNNPAIDPFDLCAGERRRCPRKAGRRVEVLVAEGPTRTPIASGWVRDCSLDGLGLALPRPLRAGAMVRVRRADGSAAWVPLRVTYCRRQKERWLAGGQFHAAPPWSGLLFES